MDTPVRTDQFLQAAAQLLSKHQKIIKPKDKATSLPPLCYNHVFHDHEKYFQNTTKQMVLVVQEDFFFYYFLN